jgi:DnaJ-domain-containing protein 1
MKNYYAALQLDEGADEDAIKKAYRTLAKQYHPDINPEPQARERFLEIHEAYEYLMDPSRRAAFERRYERRTISKEELERRERIYREWLRHQQEAARERASGYARQTFDEFSESRWYKVAKGVNKLYNVLFLLFCVAVISIPVYKYIEQQDFPEDEQRSFVYFAVPIIAGLVFATWGYYYWFILKHDDI